MPARSDGEPVTLDIRDASITTAAVTIKALQVGKKQMTQSVFKQLPVGELIDDRAAQLRCDPWGWVNYSVGEQGPSTRNFVVPSDERLYRCPVWMRRSEQFPYLSEGLPDGYWSLFKDAVELEKFRIYIKIIKGIDVSITSNSIYNGELRVNLYETHWHRFGHVSLHENDLVSFNQYRDGGSWLSGRDREKKVPLLAEATEKKFGKVPDLGEIEGRIAYAERLGMAYAVRWDAMMERLEAVEQLYIAC